MPGTNLNPEEIKDLIVSQTESEGWLSEYVKELTDYVPYLSTSLTKVNKYFNSAIEYIPSGEDVWNYGRSWLVAKESEDEFKIILRIPKWILGNVTERLDMLGSTYKSLSGVYGANYTVGKLVKAVVNRDPICFALSCTSLFYDLAKIGSNIFPYKHNCTKNDAINYSCKLATEVCERYKVCDKIKKVWSFVRSDKMRKFYL